MLGSSLSGYITAIDHWVAFVLLAGIGLKMIWEATHRGEDEAATDGGVPVRELLILGVATSVDALAVGISFAFLDVSIVPAILLIGLTTFLLSLVGVAIGHRAGKRFQGPAEIVGGLILILIGTQILVEHLGVI